MVAIEARSGLLRGNAPTSAASSRCGDWGTVCSSRTEPGAGEAAGQGFLFEELQQRGADALALVSGHDGDFGNVEHAAGSRRVRIADGEAVQIVAIQRADAHPARRRRQLDHAGSRPLDRPMFVPGFGAIGFDDDGGAEKRLIFIDPLENDCHGHCLTKHRKGYPGPRPRIVFPNGRTSHADRVHRARDHGNADGTQSGALGPAAHRLEPLGGQGRVATCGGG
ncbi:conserved hypothetical protein [Ricinus communis]|uniref:Uncharacterized protein n=1 Tax=Ricinus communis TaxID=3988 RepID=B9TNT6_RICCO|nr:conserved hypothetical protein [Ricinus communis]